MTEPRRSRGDVREYSDIISWNEQSNNSLLDRMCSEKCTSSIPALGSDSDASNRPSNGVTRCVQVWKEGKANSRAMACSVVCAASRAQSDGAARLSPTGRTTVGDEENGHTGSDRWISSRVHAVRRIVKRTSGEGPLGR